MRKSDALRKVRTFASRMHCSRDSIRFPSRDAEFNALMRDCHLSYHRAEEFRRILRLADYVQDAHDDACRRKPAKGGNWECWRPASQVRVQVQAKVRQEKKKKNTWIVVTGKVTVGFRRLLKLGA